MVEYIFKKLNKPIERKDIFEFYYRNIDDEKQIVCHERDYASLTASQKQDIVIVVLNNKKIKTIKKRFIYVPTRNYRGDRRNSFLNNVRYNGRFKLKDTYVNEIKKVEPFFPFTHIDSFFTGDTDQILDIQENDVLRIIYDDLNYNPLLFMRCTNPKLDKYFRTIIGIVSKKHVTTLSTEQQTELKQLMSEDVNEIKELIEKEEVGKSLKPTSEELQQRHFYLYDNSNLVKPTLITELNKKVSIYGKIEVAAVNDTNKNKLISPDKALQYEIDKNIFKENLSFELQNITKQKVIKTVDSKVYNKCYNDSTKQKEIHASRLY